MLTNPVFSEWYKKPAGMLPVERLGQAYADELGSTTLAVNLSAETAMKQQRSHPDIAASDYRHLQETIDRGTAIKDGDRAVLFVLEDGGFVSVIKSTRTGKGVFVTSFRRLSREAAKRDAEMQLRLRKEQ